MSLLYKYFFRTCTEDRVTIQKNGYITKGFSLNSEYFYILSEKVDFFLAGGGSNPLKSFYYALSYAYTIFIKKDIRCQHTPLKYKLLLDLLPGMYHIMHQSCMYYFKFCLDPIYLSAIPPVAVHL